jgi:uncharacterized protein YkwD
LLGRVEHLAVVVALCAAALVLPAAAGADFSPPPLGPVAGCGADVLPPPSASPAELDAARRSLLCGVNRERVARGLKRLRIDSRLNTAAQAHTRDMVFNRFFSHVGTGGGAVGRARKFGYVPNDRGWAVGEAIGWQWYGEGSPVRLLPHVLQSPMHYAQLMSSTYTDAGVGYVPTPPDATGKPGATCTVMLGHIFPVRGARRR